MKKTLETLGIEIDAKKRLCQELEEKANLLSEDISVKEGELTSIEAVIEEFSIEKDTHRKTKIENARIKNEVCQLQNVSLRVEKQIEESKIKLEEVKYKLDLQEDGLNLLKKQIDTNNNLLKDKQLELFNLEKKIARCIENLEENQSNFNKYDQIINGKRY